ncbi:hypothetical protein C8J57DRAFT_1670401 [Mycena rebaudengoi]|nr:hypothetical protein C8J57DRAFT_1670401 [Mycena rebaudengoi]
MDPDPPKLNLILFVGGIEIGALLATILLGMATVQIYVYYRHFPNDSWYIKSMIAIIWLIETAHVAAICYGLYTMTITGYGHLDLPLPFEMCIAAILGNAIHPLVQAIFTARIYQLGRRKPIPIISWTISGFILGATVILSVKMFSAASIEQYENDWSWLLLVLFCSTACVDVLIAASMTYYTVQHRAMLAQKTSNRFDAFIVWTSQTGVFNAVVGILVAATVSYIELLLPVAVDDAVIIHILWFAILFLATGLYSNSLLSLLNGRLTLYHQSEAPFFISTVGRTVPHQVSFVHPAAPDLKPPSDFTGSKPTSARADVAAPPYTMSREHFDSEPCGTEDPQARCTSM